MIKPLCVYVVEGGLDRGFYEAVDIYFNEQDALRYKQELDSDTKKAKENGYLPPTVYDTTRVTKWEVK